ncbi:unnamed protein product [Rotaria magnacalcarata]|uniref:Uncharacterized protein n=1 Tax=Rotaria magnacalcarata TaxID=392030 RepID=A0A816ZQH5_9BILA|nr:unnamed protein product [Rotaria magnacalcarata]CAF3858351.1 unnamed protein product [Rotaria magnacalcarata]
MQHTDLSYNHDSDANVPDEHLPKEQIVLSSEPTQPTSNDPKMSPNVNLNNLSRITIDKNDVSLDLDEVNIENKPILFIIKIVASVIDSAVDLETSVNLFWAWRSIK